MIVYGTPFCLPRRLGSINIFARDDSHHHLQQLRSRSHIVSGFERVIYLNISIAKTLVRFRPVYACNDFLHGFLLRSGLPVIRPGFNTQSGIRDRRTILFRLNVTNNKLNHLAKLLGHFATPWHPWASNDCIYLLQKFVYIHVMFATLWTSGQVTKTKEKYFNWNRTKHRCHILTKLVLQQNLPKHLMNIFFMN